METVATPKQIRELMKVDGLTNDEVKSHLQVKSLSSSLVFFYFFDPHIKCVDMRETWQRLRTGLKLTKLWVRVRMKYFSNQY